MASLISPLAVRRRLVSAADVTSTSYGLRSATRILVLFGIDCLAILAATLIGFHLWEISGHSWDGLTLLDRAVLFNLAAPSAVLLAYFAGRGRYAGRMPYWSEVRLVTCAGLCAVATVGLLGFSIGDTERRLPAIAAILLFCLLATYGNRLAKQALASLGLWASPAVIVGDATATREAAAVITSDTSLGYQVVGQLEPAVLMSAGDGPRLKSAMARYHAQCLLIAIGDPRLQRVAIETALRERIPFTVVMLPGFTCRLTQFFAHNAMLLSYRDGLSRSIPRFIKAAFDVSVAALMLVVTSPLLFAIAAIAWADGGPALYAHRRIGVGGRHFHCLKFRTMVVNADRVLQDLLDTDPERAAEWRATQKLRDDPRVTRFGKILRQTSLDELPQLINVIRLEMSLVGPRPIIDSETVFYGEDIASYRATRPGMTGVWQVSGRSDTSYARRVQLDVWYANNWTIWYDIAVLIKTIPVVLKRAGAR